MSSDKALRKHVLYLLSGGGAHLSVEEVIADIPPRLRGVRLKGAPHTAWQLLEHMRIAQWDIVEFSRNPDHISPNFPDGYWPPAEAPPDRRSWGQSVARFRADLAAMRKLVGDPSVDLLKPIPHGDGQTVLREALLIADHNAYHLGQFVLLSRLLKAWRD
jgi:hypothetical protein